MVEYASHHVVAVDENGEPRHPITHGRISEDAFKKCVSHILNGATAFGAEHGSKTKILIYIHGGLNPKDSAKKKAQVDASKILAAGYYPIFIGWRSALRPTLLEHLLRVRQRRVATSRQVV